MAVALLRIPIPILFVYYSYPAGRHAPPAHVTGLVAVAKGNGSSNQQARSQGVHALAAGAPIHPSFVPPWLVGAPPARACQPPPVSPRVVSPIYRDLLSSPILLFTPTAAACMRRVLHFYALRDRSKEQAARLQYHTGRHVTSCAAIKLHRPAVIGRPPDPTADPDPSCTAALAARATGKLSTTSQASHSCFYNSGTYVRHTAGERVAKNLRSHH